MSGLVQAGFEILVEAGYQPEMAYFECLHELKFIVDLVHREGIRGMRARISETAKWGDISVGPKIVDARVKARMKTVLKDIQRGEFAKEWLRETATGRKRYRRLLDLAAQQPIEKVGERLRSRMPWLDENS
jgi:ketol-acid reductoisomerase